MKRLLMYLFRIRSWDSHFSKYMPDCCSTPFNNYLKQLNIIEQTTNGISRFNRIEFGKSPEELVKSIGKPSYAKRTGIVLLLLYKRKICGLKFVLTFCFLNNKLVYFISECRENKFENQSSLLNIVQKKYNCEIGKYHFNNSCGLLVTNLFTVKVEAFSLNREHVKAMRAFGESHLIKHESQKVFSLRESKLNQII